ncbi:hypothetical protein [Sphingobacterium thalpophilum]|uniref:Uncharacterized protein n=1 Tax=Sphingobacterium thalpophilum TaxID=259 RepID=A0A4U9V796_9SPHI|nr:hypothetical protein [Sphingobacterium thalpophilum]VTR41713.1 Uncharacterised protein [Sphingobacterium thalpophilum]
MFDRQDDITVIKKLIENKLHWGDSDQWQARDFENLSEQIFNETKTVLSPSTLKRIWGKVHYKSSPNLSTLDTLAKFIGYSSWRSFCGSNSGMQQTSEPRLKVNKKLIYILVSLLLITALSAGSVIYLSFSKRLSFETIAFSSKTIAVGVPNTVIFKYDAIRSNADSVFIQQSWDPKRRARVDKGGHEYGSIYYMPGYYRAKLILNDSIVKEHDVFIESNGWLGVLMKQPIPTYLPSGLLHRGDMIGVGPDDLKLDTADLSLNIPEFVLTNVSKQLMINSENFRYEMDIQHTLNHSNAPCKQTRVMILGTEGVISIPLALAGCVENLKLRIGEQLFEGHSHDLSKFGVDFSNVVNLRCLVHARRIEIQFDHQTVYSGPFIRGIGKIVGTRIVFDGTGKVSNFSLGQNMG